MEKIRVLCMDDDNHDAQFVTEDWHTYSDARSFITNRLAQPHTDSYEIRGFHICDYNDIPNFDDDAEIERLFDIIVGYIEVPEDEWHIAFDTLWQYSSKWWHA